MGSKTPYETWFNKRPNVSQLREFGAPVWILLQGQKEPPKMLPKSKQHAYIGYDDGSKSVVYYDAETRRILKSRNYCFLTLPKIDSPSKGIEVAPDLPHEGEEEGIFTWSSGELISPGTGAKRKQDDEDVEPRKTRGKKVDYCHLNDSFSDEEEDSLTSEDQLEYTNTAIIPGDELHS